MFDSSVLQINCAAEAARIVEAIRQITGQVLRKRGLVVGVSGGVDSSTCLALAARALGPQRVQALLMPERDSSADSLKLGQLVCEQYSVPFLVEDISPVLDAVGCYRRRDEAIRQIFPEYDQTYKQKIVIPPLDTHDRITFFTLVVQAPDGTTKRARLPHKAYLQLVAATNFKQRTRKMVEYYHADRLNYAVIGTPNRLEYDQGFFVKGGDGLADLKPIAHLYKTQVFALARELGLPSQIVEATPTTDTYSLAQGQDEFFFALPYDKMDLLLAAHNLGVDAAKAAAAAHLTVEQARRVYRDIETKRRTTRYLHLGAQLVDAVQLPDLPPD